MPTDQEHHDAVTALPFRPDGWTVDDLDELPDDGYRYELIDGALLVSPPPDLAHDDLAAQLVLLLGPLLPTERRVAQAPGIYFAPGDYRQPDVVVYQREALRRRHLAPSDVVLAVEVVSVGSLSNDRVAKPALYAGAGIPHFWRLEQEPLALSVHRLDGGVYREVASFDDEVVVGEPVTLRFRLPDLLP